MTMWRGQTSPCTQCCDIIKESRTIARMTILAYVPDNRCRYWSISLNASLRYEETSVSLLVLVLIIGFVVPPKSVYSNSHFTKFVICLRHNRAWRKAASRQPATGGNTGQNGYSLSDRLNRINMKSLFFHRLKDIRAKKQVLNVLMRDDNSLSSGQASSQCQAFFNLVLLPPLFPLNLIFRILQYRLKFR